ncbi:MAG: PAS domain-containing protein [Nitritalea sp.]
MSQNDLYTQLIQLGRTGIFQEIDWHSLTTEELRSDERLRSLLDALSQSVPFVPLRSSASSHQGGIWIVDHRQQHIYWSDSLLQLFERSTEQGPPDSATFFSYVHPSARQETQHQFERHLQKESGYTVYQPILLPSGKQLALFSRAHTRFSPKGHPLYTYGYSVTLSSLPAYIEQVQQIDAMQANIINLLDEIIHFKEEDVNKRIQNILEELGKACGADRVYLSEVDTTTRESISNLFEWTQPAISSVKANEQNIPLELLGSYLNDLKAGEELFIADVHQLADGPFKTFLLQEKVLSLLLVPIVENQQLTGLIGCDFVQQTQLINFETSNIFQAAAKIIKGTYSNRRLLQENQKAVEEFSYLFSTMEQGVVYQNQRGEITNANPAAEKLLGLSIAQMQGRTSTSPEWHAIRGDGSPFPGEEHPAMQVLRTGIPVNQVEMGVFHPSKQRYVWILVSASPIFEGLRTSPSGVFSTFTSYTDLKRSKLKLQRQSELQLTLVKLSTSLIRATKADMDQELNKAIASIGEATQADRTYIFSYDWEAYVCHNTHEWCAPGTVPMIEELQNFPLTELQSWTEAHLAGKKMHVPRIEAIADDKPLYELLEPQGIKSLLALPIYDGTNCIGFVGLDFVQNYHTITKEEEELIELLAGMLGQLFFRVNSEEELKKSRILLDNLYRNSGSLIYIKDVQGRYEEVNPKWTKTTGFSWHDVHKKTDLELFPESIAREFMTHDQQVLYTGETLEVEEVLQQEDEPLRYFISIKFPLYDATQKLVGSGGITTEITDRKRVELQLIREEANKKAILNSVQEGVWAVDKEMRFIFFNEKIKWDFEVDFGIKIKIGDHLLAALPPKDQERYRIVYDRVFRTGKPFYVEETITTPKRKREFELSFYPIMQNKEVVGVSVFSKDISEQRAIDRMLEEKETRLSLVFDKAGLPMLLVSIEDAQIVEINEKARKLYGISEKSTAPLTYAALTGDNVASLEEMKSQVGREGAKTWFSHHQNAKKQRIAVELSASLISLSGKEMLHLAIYDVTKEQQHLQTITSQNKLLKNIAWTQSHLMRAPLTKIMSISQLIRGKDYSLMTEEHALDKLMLASLELDQAIRDLTTKINISKSMLLRESGEEALSPQSALSPEGNKPEIQRVSEFILIDDDQMMHLLHKQVLKKITGAHEIRISTFLNPIEGLNYLRKRKGTLTEAILFLDINMPEMNGWQLLDACVAEQLEPKVIMLSSSENQEDIEKAFGYPPVIEYMTKPLNKAKLEQLLG